MIVNFEAGHVEGIVKLWNDSAVKDGYKELTIESFGEVFLKNPYFSPESTFVRMEEGRVAGFACGCTGNDLPRGDISGYVTCIILAPHIRTLENFSALLGRLEEVFRARGKQTAEVLFFNPIMLPWYIPDTPGHEHNNAPGAPVGSFFHAALLKNGYFERTREAAMYLNLNGFSMPADILKKEQAAEAMGYEIGLFDKARHLGVEEMLKELNNPLWQREIADCTERGIPVVIAAAGRQPVGFAGPVIRQPSGRGYFTGIGIHPAHEGKGLGSILFFRLCQEFKDRGTPYMSLYTGKENPAIKIYIKAGFTVVREFAVMRKEL